MNYLREELYELLKKDVSFFDLMQDASLDGLWYWDLQEPENVWMDLRFWVTLGYRPGNIPDRRGFLMSTVNKEDLNLPMILRTVGSDNLKQAIRFQHNNGLTVLTMCEGKIIRNDAGEPVRVLWAVVDTSSAKQIQRLLEDSNQLARIGTWEVDLVTGQPTWNKITKQIHDVPDDYVPDMLTSINFYKEGESREKISAAVEKAIRDGAPYDIELQLITAGQREKWVRTIGLTEQKDGKCLKLYGTFQDITEKKQAEYILRKNNELNKIFIEQSANAIAMFDKDMCYMAASGKWMDYYGLKGRDIIGVSHYDVFPEITDEWKNIHKECLKGAIRVCDEDSFIRQDGTVQWITWDVRPWYITDDNIGGLLMYTADITERKRVQEKLRISEESFRSAFEHSAIGMALVDASGKWMKVNSTLCSMVGYTQDELMKITFQDITFPEDRERDLNMLYEMVAGEREYYQVEKRYLHKKGHIVWVILTVSMIRDNDGRPHYCVSQMLDITTRKIAEHELQFTLSKLKGVLDASTQVVIIGTDVNGMITSVNKGAENVLGYKQEELIYKHTPRIFHIPEEVEERSRQLSEQFGREITGFEVFTANARQGKFDSGEWTFLRKDATLLQVQLVVTAIRDNAGEIEGFLGVATDISRIKKVENEMRVVLDLTNDQNKRLLNFAHIVSHNLRSHTVNLNMLLDCLDTETDQDSRDEMYLMLKQAASNLQDTITHLNEVVAMNTKILENLRPVALNKAVNVAVGNVHALLDDVDGSYVNNVDDDLTVNVVPAYLDSILLNLVTNAIKYRSEERAPRIEIYTEKEPGAVVLYIKDNGIGIDMRRHGDKVFGMYKTFHNNKDARGIGLFITKNQVDAMGGQIEIDSEVGKGTTFKIHFRDRSSSNDKM